MKTEMLGWLSSLVLLITISKQIHKQWRDRTSEGVSKWLFIGQFTASGGFAAYSYLIHSWVFVLTNTLMACAAVVGWAIVLRARREGRAANHQTVKPIGGAEPGVS